MMTNRLSFGGIFDALRGGAALLSFRTSNLPPSKEGGEGDCGYSDEKVLCVQAALSRWRQPFVNVLLDSSHIDQE
jgi:hypothetical protein